MLFLRIAARESTPGTVAATLTLAEGSGQILQGSATVSVDISPKDHESLRWYLEDYLEHDAEPAPTVAAEVELRIRSIGERMFAAIFDASPSTRAIWQVIGRRLGATHIRIDAEFGRASELLWELIREPSEGIDLAVEAASLSRVVRSRESDNPPARLERPLRILLIISRPAGAQDVPFRSVARRLVSAAFSGATDMSLTVLRPATFDSLRDTLHEAHAAGTPYQIVHFDGHGGYSQGRGVVFFENEMQARNEEAIRGITLGGLLRSAGVQILVLNACRSAYSEAPTVPAGVGDTRATPDRLAYGSLAQEAIDAGLQIVVAMRHNVYVVTAAQFMWKFYAALGSVNDPLHAFSISRRMLHRNPSRAITFVARRVQDWTVPVLYASSKWPAPTYIYSGEEPSSAEMSPNGETPASAHVSGDARLVPATGFLGRDETLLGLDQACTRHSVVVLYGYAGAGKTSLASEFGRWYSLTGGVHGPVLFSSFERHRSLGHVLSQDFAAAFATHLAATGVLWHTLSTEERRRVAVETLQATSSLWIWDNMESLDGGGEAFRSVWTQHDRAELSSFLATASAGKARFILTSRRAEGEFIGAIPHKRVEIGPMGSLESLQLLKALAQRRGLDLPNLDDWRPLLWFTQGNPLALSVLFPQAHAVGVRTKVDVETFVSSVRSGRLNNVFDKPSEGYQRSLFVSFAYALETRFSHSEHRQVALLALFEGFLDGPTWAALGAKRQPWRLAEMERMTQTEGESILARLRDVGMLHGLGAHQYRIHPASPLFLQALFVKLYARPRALRAYRAFVEVMVHRSQLLADQIQQGNRNLLGIAELEESNLLRARRTAIDQGWLRQAVEIMATPLRLYVETGRSAELGPLIAELIPAVVDEQSDAPRQGLESPWHNMMHLRILAARGQGDTREAERIQSLWEREGRFQAAAAPSSKTLSDTERRQILWLTIAIHERGINMMQQGKSECVQAFEEDFELSVRINDQARAAVTASNLANAYNTVEAIRDPDKAQFWSRLAMQFRDPRDPEAPARFALQSAMTRFNRLAQGSLPPHAAREFLREARREALQALNLFRIEALQQRNVTHHLLGNIFSMAGDPAAALHHYEESLILEERQRNAVGAAETRLSIAQLLRTSDPARALRYAEAALSGLVSLTDPPTKMVEWAHQLISSLRPVT